MSMSSNSNPQSYVADTICAPATKTGGALAIVRVSGPEAIAIVDAVFRSRSGHHLADAHAQTLHYGEILEHDGHAIDDVVASIWRAPHSYTGEDSVELSCHGSAWITERIVGRLCEAGCRMAKPGEFTLRAYLSGKMDLSQAEAVDDLIRANSRAAHDLALSQLRGHFSHELSTLRNRLLRLTSLLELELDFSDHEDLEFADRSELRQLAEQIDGKIVALAQSFAAGQAIRKGISVAIVGKTNTGKSTLLNRLLHEERAIVSDVAGTTRDLVDGTIDIDGLTFRFIDTAGLRQTDDRIEQIGIDRAYSQIERAAIVIWVTDTPPSADEEADIRSRAASKPLIVVRNKADLLKTSDETLSAETETSSAPLSATSIPSSQAEPSDSLRHPTAYSLEKGGGEASPILLSAKTGQGIDHLLQRLREAAGIPAISDASVIVTSARHYDALQRAHADLRRMLTAMDAGLTADLLAEDLRLCLADLADITGGAITPTETLNNIFSHFCIGK